MAGEPRPGLADSSNRPLVYAAQVPGGAEGSPPVAGRVWPMIYVDADACPVKAEAERVATRHGIRIFVVSNGGIRPSPNPLVETVIVPRGRTWPTNGSQVAQDRGMWW